VLTTRIAHLLSTGIDAFNILALTFTNKAAKEMKERIERILGTNEARNLYIGTFHSVFARILRAEAPKLGYPHHFTIYDTDDAKSVVKTVVNELNLDDKHYKPNIVYNRISQAKNGLITAAEYATDYYIQQEDIRSNRPAIAQIYEAYAKRCFKNGSMDFDDLLLKFYELLKNFPESLHKYQHKFKYILIDEFQDTNAIQYKWLMLLAGPEGMPFVVGDDDQCLAAGTQVTMGDGAKRAIESIVPGDSVLSNYGSGDLRPARVTECFAKRRQGQLVCVHLRSGAVVKSTPEHVHFAGYVLGETPQTYFLYLMHKEGIDEPAHFEQIRSLILMQSDFVVQDDSGVPLRLFARDTWKLRFHGRYEAPTPEFGKHLQKDLKVEMQRNSTGRLPFSYGYAYQQGESNLMTAERIQ